MSNFLDKIKIRTAVGQKNKFDLSCDHVTTQEFFHLRPVYARELMPGQSISVKASSFVRLAPLFKPMFGSVKLINRAFFVPYSTVFDSFNNFLTNTPYNHDGSNYSVTQVPWFSSSDLVGILMGADYSVTVSAGSAYDFMDYANTRYYRFTRKGQIVMTIFNSLGYNLNMTSVSISGGTFDVSMSALPLFCFMKVIADWYVNNQYVTRRNAILNFISNYWQGGQVNASELADVLQYIVYSLYDNDYFTSAFDNPVNPTSSAIDSVSLTDVTNDSTSPDRVAQVVSYSTPVTNSPSTPSTRATTSNTSAYPLTQYILDSLKSLTDFMKRYQLVGSSVLDRMLAEYGQKPTAEALNRSVYLGKTETNIQVSDVMATADTVNGVVGDYAAKGIGFADGKPFTYTTGAEFGLMVIVSTIVPRSSYSQGVVRRNLHIDRFDFFRGDFDALGPQAIACCELFNDFKTINNFDAGTNMSWNASGIFGYTPRYSEYAIANDTLSGCFRFNAQNADLEAWHLFRMFNPEEDEDVSLIQHHSENFSIGDATQYNRIFNYSADGNDGSQMPTDHFFAVHHFDVTSYMPKKPLFDQYDFEDGRNIMMNLGGTNLN